MGKFKQEFIHKNLFKMKIGTFLFGLTMNARIATSNKLIDLFITLQYST